MALVVLDRAQETTTTTGTGTLTLAGAASGMQSFAGVGNGNTTYYTIVSGTDWEVGIGTYTASGTTLSRDTVLSSSAGGAKINVASGATVFGDYPAGKMVSQDAVLATTAYNSAYTDGVVIDYVSPNGRISVGGGDGIAFYNGGVAGSLLGSVNNNGDWSIARFLDVGNGTLVGGTTNPLIAAAGSANGYVEVYCHNDNSGTSASSDFVAYPNNGADATGWVDLGVNSSTFSDVAYSITTANEGYLLMSNPSTATTATGNLVYATDSTGTSNAHQWYVGGFTQAKSAYKMQLNATNLLVKQAIQANGVIESTTGGFKFPDATTQTTAAFGTVTSVAALTLGTTGTDLSSTVATGTTTPVITLNVPTASATNRGVLSSTDWSTFNGKQAALGYTPVNKAGDTMTGALNLVAGTTSVAPLDFSTGSLLTTAAAGAMEFDGTVPYFSIAASTRGAVPTEQLVVLNGTYTLTSQTAAQKLFNATTNGAVTLPVGTYQFECSFALTGISATSGSFGFALGGTATKTQQWFSIAGRNNPTSTANTSYTTFNTAANTSLTVAGTTSGGEAFIKGIIRVTVAGTIIPQVSLTVAAAAIVQAGSYFKISPIGNATVTTVGNWS